MLTETQVQEVEVYGTLLSDTETIIELARRARIQYLKKKMRPRLGATIGDYGDNITDTVRALVLGHAIQLGIVTDKAVVDAYRSYITSMLDGYGGAGTVMQALSAALSGLQAELVARYYQAKLRILAAATIDEINAIDLPGEPASEGARESGDFG